MKDLMVIKKDGSEVNFDKTKIIETCIAAGTSKKTAKKVADDVLADLLKVSTSQIHDLILKKLEELDPEAYHDWIQHHLRKAEDG